MFTVIQVYDAIRVVGSGMWVLRERARASAPVAPMELADLWTTGYTSRSYGASPAWNGSVSLDQEDAACLWWLSAV